MVRALTLSRRQMRSSTPLEMLVARATPIMPSLGAPKSPNINTAFKRMFKTRAEPLAAVANMTRSMARMVHKYTWEMLMNR